VAPKPQERNQTLKRDGPKAGRLSEMMRARLEHAEGQESRREATRFSLHGYSVDSPVSCEKETSRLGQSVADRPNNEPGACWMNRIAEVQRTGPIRRPQMTEPR